MFNFKLYSDNEVIVPIKDISDMDKEIAELKEQLKRYENFVEEICIDDCGFNATLESHASLVMILESWDKRARNLLTQQQRR